MMRLNIIPKNLKKEVKIKAIYDFLKNIFEIAILLMIIYITILLVLKIILANHFVTTIENTTILTKSTQDYSRKVTEINTQVQAVESIQKDFVFWSQIINQIRKTQTSGIAIDKLSLNKETNSISLGGKAQTRDDLLIFKDNLEKIEYLGTIDLPIKNLLQKNDIIFNIIVSIKNYEY